MENKKRNFKSVIWTINGIAVLLIAIWVISNILAEMIPDYDTTSQGGIMVGKKKNEAKKDRVELQTIRYSRPTALMNTDYKMITISQTDYEIPRKVAQLAKQANGFSYGVLINIIFLNEQNNDYRLLLDSLACIKQLDAPYWKSDSFQTCIVYQISFDDTNEDGLINNHDIGDLFISDLDGNNFIKIAPDSMVVTGYDFTADRSGIYLYCLKRAANPAIAREHWQQVSAFYEVAEQRFVLNERVNSLIERARQILVD